LGNNSGTSNVSNTTAMSQNVPTNNTLTCSDESRNNSPGGKLGAVLEDGTPDLRNFQLYHFRFSEKLDLIIFMTPVIFDNFVPPSKEQVKKKTLFTSIRDKKPEIKAAEVISEMERVIKLNEQNGNPEEVVQILVKHTEEATENKRNFLTKVPKEKFGKADEKEYSKFSGKMGHGTCVAFRVGRLINEGIAVMDRDDGAVKDLKVSTFVHLKHT